MLLTRAAVRASSSCECSRSCSASTSPLSAWIAASLAANSRWYSCAAACTWPTQQQGDHAWSTGEPSVGTGHQVMVCRLLYICGVSQIPLLFLCRS